MPTPPLELLARLVCTYMYTCIEHIPAFSLVRQV